MALPARTYKLSSSSLCVGCKREVNPTQCRKGSVLVGINFATRIEEKLISCSPVRYSHEEKRVPYTERKKGFICDLCATNYHHVGGQPLVVTDPLPMAKTHILTNDDGF